jgi:hypothetical protein
LVVYCAANEVPEGGRDLPFVEKYRGLLVEQRLRRGGYEGTGTRIHIKAKFVVAQPPRCFGLPASLGAFDEYGAGCCQAIGEFFVGDSVDVCHSSAPSANR